ncbi:hypothetical protein MNBD_GAMMA07-1010 [hydrothermal vent metagenome]|uniref:Uncharacterized protein n=1 Tax=hydrothermal vent metagenome TaxID=652676 RepID=A0A3B0WTJ8_9ZZZZ
MVNDMGKIMTREHKPGTPFDDSHIDYSEADALTEEQIENAAKSDPDAQPLTEEHIKNLKIRRPNIEGENLKNG